MTQEERNKKTADALEALANIAENQANYINHLEQKLVALENVFQKHDKAIGLVLKEVKELKDAKNKVTIYKP
jgi:hypothetical protein